MALKKPIKIGKYEVVGLLGKGGMGVVYKANDPLLGRAVAIKMMTTLDYVDNPDLLQRFYREAQSTGNLHHRNIVTVYELGDHEGSPYLVMEYLEGETLDAVIQSNRPVPIFDRINIILEVCDGLSYAHGRSVVHRDIKPGNIMVLKDSGVKIVDFGIAHIGNRTVTRTGQLLGSLPYMSPEQISGKQVDARTDIFSLGVVFYQLLTSHLPFEGETPAATLLKIIQERPKPLSEYGSFPPELDDILLHALAKDREQRYPSAQDLAFDLIQIRGRIQQELVDEYLNEAELLLSREELVKARERLTDVLKIDRHNTRAVELSRATFQRVQQQELGEQVRQLRTQAEEAYQKEQFDQALDAVQKAINLHPTDRDLQRLRSTFQEAKSRAERLHSALKRAESAYEQGELDSAKQAIEEAMALAPEDVQAKSLDRIIQRDWAQRAQRLQVQGLIEEARKEIASRNFTLAIEVLRKAEAIDATAPEVRALIDAAQSAREQERRRKALEAIKREIEGDLDRDDFQLAFLRAETALEEYPEDRSLQKLKELAQKQRIFAERKSFIKDQISQSRTLVESGKAQEALELLQAAREKVGSDPQLESLMVVVRETIERQRIEAKKAEFLRQAKDQLRLKQYDSAIATLKNAQAALGDNAELEDLLQFAVEQQIAEQRRQVAEAAAQKAQAFVENAEYEKAVEVLEAALREAPDEELRLILTQSRQAAADQRKLLAEALANTESMLQGQRPVEALRYLESQPELFAHDARFTELLRKAREQSQRLQYIEEVLAQARTHLERNEFDSATGVLQACIRTHGRTPDLNKLIAEVELRQGEALAATIQQALGESRTLISEGKPDQAIERLSSIHTMAGKVPPEISKALQSLQQEAANAQARKYRGEIEQLIAEGSHSEAASLLSRAQAEFPLSRELQQLSKSLQQAAQKRADAEKLVDEARALFAKRAWREGADLCMRAWPLILRDAVARNGVLYTLESAASSAVAHDWRHAEYLLQCMAQLQPHVALRDEIKDQIARAQQEEAIQEILRKATENQAQGDLVRALNAVRSALEDYPAEARLVDLQEKLRRAQLEKQELDRRERERRERQEYLADVRRSVQEERIAEDRVTILEQALRKYPDAAELQQGLAQARELQRKVAFFADEAHRLEKTDRYEEALRSWEGITQLGVVHADTADAIARLTRRRNEARAAAKTNWIDGIQAALAGYDLDKAGSLLAEAQHQIPNDPDLTRSAASREKLLSLRQDSFNLLKQAQGEFSALRWQQASELIENSRSRAFEDPAVAKAAFAAVIGGTKDALAKDLPAAEKLLKQAATIYPSSPEIPALQATLQKRIQEETVNRRFADVQAIAQSADTERALLEVKAACSAYPNEPRFQGLKQELERTIAAERKAREQRARMLEILEAAQSLRGNGDLQGSLQKVEQGLQDFPGHSQFVEMKRSLERAIRDLEKQNQREEKQRTQAAAAQQKLQRQEQKRRERDEKRRLEAESAAARTSAPAKQASRPMALYLAAAAAVLAIVGGVVWISTHHTTQPSSSAALSKLQINTTPNGATVRNPETGASCVTPNCSLQLPPGTHELKIDLPGYESTTRSVSVDGGAASPLTVALVPLPRVDNNSATGSTSAAAANLDLRSVQPGAEVLLDNRSVGKVSNRGTFSTPVPAGDHQVLLLSRNREIGSVQRQFSSGNRVELSGGDFAAPKVQPPAERASAEQTDWQNVKDSKDAAAVDGFLKRYPNGALTSEARSKLEGLVWSKALSSSTSAGYGQYLEQFPSGKYAQQAQAQIADLDWRAVETSSDAGALQDFLKKYPAGNNHDKALAKLDDLSWQRTNQNDVASLRNYASSFPDGRHSADARKKITDLNRPAATTRSTDSQPASVPDDNKVILDVLNRYQKAYQDENVEELKQIWPGMTGVQIKGVGDFFQLASSLSLQYQVTQTEITGDSATVRFTQTLRYTAGGRPGKNSAKIVMLLNRMPGGAWQINSIR